MKSTDDVLHGWKDIAAYVSRDVSTVKRWEKQRGLPVRRVPGDGRANVYAHSTELAQWLASGGPDSVDDEVGGGSPGQEQVLAPVQAEERALARSADIRHRWPVWFWAAVGIGCLTAILLVTAHHLQSASPVAPLPAEASFALRNPSKVPGVEDLTYRGVYSYEKRTPDSLAQAETYFQESVAKDPRYAPAYAGLAITYNLMREYGSMPSVEAYAKSRFAAERAISLDPRLSDAHAALGFIQFFWDWNAPGAEREFQTAIALDPGSALARHWFGSMLTHEGRFAEAVEQLEIAQRLDPSSTSILLARSLALGFGGHRQQAIDLLHQISDQDPEFGSVHLRLGTICMVEPGDLNMYFSETETWAQLRHDAITLASNRRLEQAFKTKGEAAMWRLQLREDQASHPSERTTAMAAAQAELGNKDAAFAILQELAEHHAVDLIGINLRPQLKSLHADPRYNEVLEIMGLPPLPKS
jgi:tetratricopeptide (TPR) repeat protein